ncbi:MAG: leucine--tRNA ligase [Rhodothermaeota bacterium MED-G18]|nr:MAG: leucine--tRNA ligase [Rhodothermaeota bacterium MED-G18]
MRYNFKSIEKKWQEYWEKNKTYKTEINNKPKYYVMDMFPYPSGSGLHVGHPLGYIASDIISRFKKLKGYNVLHPMGFDSFGLPAEQYAIKTGKHPKETTENNISKFKEQLNQLGLSFDWDREVRTSDSKYYKWTQWIFLKLYNSYFDYKNNRAETIEKLELPKGLSANEKIEYIDSKRLAYIDEIDVNWCEELGTVLSNEEVIGGVSERGGFPVIRRPMRQWVMRITDFSERLLEDLDTLDWPDSIKLSQKNWIGKSTGAEICFPIDNKKNIKVFSTRPDTIYGATYLVLAPEHKMVESLTTEKYKDQIINYVDKTAKKSELERQENEKNKTGVFTGSFATNPISGEKIPIWISDYVLSSYGTGAIMAVPAHDERDYEFALKFKLEIIEVIKNDTDEKCYTGDGIVINSGDYNGIENEKFKKIVTEILESKNLGKKTVNYKLRDWIFTRQRYWGEPIPILHSNGKQFPVSEEDLPVKLPEVKSYLPTDDGLSPLARSNDWVKVNVKGNQYDRETNTMPQWAGSCWYYLRYLDPNNEINFADKEKIKYWMPVDLYIGGAEHAVLHLLYSRFWHKVLYDLGHVNTPEPFKKLVNQGMILGRSNFIYRIKNTNKFVSYNLRNEYEYTKLHVDVNIVENDKLDLDKFKKSSKEFNDAEFILEGSDYLCGFETEKMSKSKSNVVNPDNIINDFGSDTLRMYEMFLGPLEQSKPWNTNGIEGVYKFLNKFWSLFYDEDNFNISDEKPDSDELKILHTAIKKIENDIDRLSINTCVSQLMITVNELSRKKCNKREILEPLLIVLSSFAPHISEELWSRLGNNESISLSNYPKYNDEFLTEDIFEYPIMINGKLRTKIKFDINIEEKEIKSEVISNEIITKWTENKKIKKIIFIPKKIINVVI